MTLADRIRTTLAPAHDAVEKTPFAVAMSSGSISRRDYAAGLRQLGHLHAALEAALADAAPRCPELAALYDPARMARAPVVARDLAALGAAPPDAAPPAPVVTQLSESFRRWAAESPWALAGPLYVMEGSRMGSMFLTKTLSKALGVPTDPGSGLDYHADGLPTRPRDWKQFRAALSETPLPEGRQQDVVDAASATMDGLVELYGGLPVGEVPG